MVFLFEGDIVVIFIIAKECAFQGIITPCYRGYYSTSILCYFISRPLQSGLRQTKGKFDIINFRNETCNNCCARSLYRYEASFIGELWIYYFCSRFILINAELWFHWDFFFHSFHYPQIFYVQYGIHSRYLIQMTKILSIYF